MTVWHASYYRRGKGKNQSWRDRNSGVIVTGQPKIITRRGKRNIVVLGANNKFVGVEETGKHYSGQDKPPVLKKNKSAMKKYQVKVRANNPNAKKKRVSHPRRYK